MPLFMYLSGYVAFLSGAARTTMPAWTELVRRRGERLLLPFLLFGLLILVAKLLTFQFAIVDNVPASLREGVLGLVWNTAQSPATSIWYVFVLFIYCIVTPLVLALRDGKALLLALALTLFLAPLPPYAYADRVGTYFIFFVAGGFAADGGVRWLRAVNGLWLPAMALLIATIVPISLGWIKIDWSEGGEAFPYKWALLLAGLLSMPAMHGLVRHGLLSRLSLLQLLGRYVFVIYLLNTVCIGATKAVLMKLTNWDGPHFVPFAAALMVSGVVLPILVKRAILSHVPPLDRMTD
jgi:fucose 4-O-acetylase-like acetyltransferase